MNDPPQAVLVPGVDSVVSGLERQQDLAEALAACSAPSSLLIWRCQPALLTSRSETRLPRYESACAVLRAAGWPVVLRASGGAACPVGPGTVQLSMIAPVSPGTAMKANYERLAQLIQAALRGYSVVAEIGSVGRAYCPGRFDLAVGGRKIAGMAQHWFRNRHSIRCVVTVASINIEEPPDRLAEVVNMFYRNAGSPLRCEASALANMRLCGMPELAAADFAAALARQLVSPAGTRAIVANSATG